MKVTIPRMQKACIFPCSISEIDKEDQMLEIYEKVILWSDVVIVSTPIRWGNASSLYYQNGSKDELCAESIGYS